MKCFIFMLYTVIVGIAIAVIAYQRPTHLAETLRNLAHNYNIQSSPLYIFIDGPKDSSRQSIAYKNYLAVQSCAKKFSWQGKKYLLASKHNRGLQMGVRYAIDTVLSDHKSILIVEDDIVTSPYFYRFMSQALRKYRTANAVGAICAHCYPFPRKIFNPLQPYFLRHFACWGWGTWRRTWEKIEWDTGMLVQKITNLKARRILDMGMGTAVSGLLAAQNNGYIDTWDVQVGVSLFLNKQMCLYPPQSLTTNIGWRGEGSTHVCAPYDTNPPLAYYEMPIPLDLEVEENDQARKAYSKYFYPSKLIEIKALIGNNIKNIGRKLRNKLMPSYMHKNSLATRKD